MAETEKRVSPAVVIGIGLGLATLAGIVILAVAAAAPPTPPPGRATLYGKVTDAVTGEPLLGVLITLDGMQVYTDANGNYAFTDLEPGGYRLEISKEGYQPLVY